MNTEQLLALYDIQERRDSQHPSYRREATPEVVRYVSRDPSRLSFITYSLLTADNADQIIQLRRIQNTLQRPDADTIM